MVRRVEWKQTNEILTELINQIGDHTAYSFKSDSYIPGSNLAVPGVFYCIILQNSTSASIDSDLGLWVSQYSYAPSQSYSYVSVRATLLFSIVIAFITFGVEGQWQSWCLFSYNTLSYQHQFSSWLWSISISPLWKTPHILRGLDYFSALLSSAFTASFH